MRCPPCGRCRPAWWIGQVGAPQTQAVTPMVRGSTFRRAESPAPFPVRRGSVGRVLPQGPRRRQVSKIPLPGEDAEHTQGLSASVLLILWSSGAWPGGAVLGTLGYLAACPACWMPVMCSPGVTVKNASGHRDCPLGGRHITTIEKGCFGRRFQ